MKINFDKNLTKKEKKEERKKAKKMLKQIECKVQNDLYKEDLYTEKEIEEIIDPRFDFSDEEMEIIYKTWQCFAIK